MPPIRHVIFHAPGPSWDPAVAPLEQPGLGAHVQHWAAWLAQGRLALGGPFADLRYGGMMVCADGVERDDALRHAEADPAVRDGLLTFELRPWACALQR